MRARIRSMGRLTVRGVVLIAALSANVAAWFGVGALVQMAVR